VAGQHRSEEPEDVAIRRAWLGGTVLGLTIGLVIWLGWQVILWL
jgi:hypothetical protein